MNVDTVIDFCIRVKLGLSHKMKDIGCCRVLCSIIGHKRGKMKLKIKCITLDSYFVGQLPLNIFTIVKSKRIRYVEFISPMGDIQRPKTIIPKT
jgi:hypothetical protein